MKLFYLVSAIIVSVLILIASFAQVGAVCTWYLFASQTPPLIVLMQMAGLGAIVGGLLVLYWKTPAKDDDMDNGESA